ncbi:MAG TPA: orotidine-5'-phosphate decarboxylase [Streptosporangiaceae bacterium]|jgi:orotidine-5'-phosphate decarboxylase|nr:orotidine-5'-phosphate decarboxylase [Streptosporangiaceae bacterium]
MTDSFAVRFAAVRARFGPLTWGLDPSGDLMESWGLGDTTDGLERFADLMLAAVPGVVGLVKPQSAFYERHGWRGIRTLTRLISEFRAAGVLVVLDAKRGDVGTTNAAYAQAYLGPGAPMEADALTVHPYLGLRAMDAFVSRAHESGSGLLVVTRSTNPEGRAIQAAAVEPGLDRPGSLSVEQALLREIGRLNAGLAPGELGPVGAVIGPGHLAPALDLASANALFLAPGVGTQGATCADVARTFAACPDRVMPSASRSLLAAGPDLAALRAAAEAMVADLAAVLP